MSIAVDLAEGRIAMVEAVDRLERGQKNDYETFRGEMREIQRDINNGLAGMRRTVKANEEVAAGTSNSIETTLGRRLDGIEAAIRELAQQVALSRGAHG